MRKIIAIGHIYSGFKTIHIKYPSARAEPSWHPRANPRQLPDYDLIRKQRIEAELADRG